jgi:hypothetical protein
MSSSRIERGASSRSEREEPFHAASERSLFTQREKGAFSRSETGGCSRSGREEPVHAATREGSLATDKP